MSGSVDEAVTSKRVAFLFLGETLLIPHLFPIVEALARLKPGLPIDLWVSTSVHEALLIKWTIGLPGVRVRRAYGFRTIAGGEDGRNPDLPSKLPMLLALAPFLARTAVTVCAEQTSLWLPRLLPWLPTRFVKTSHGVGSMSARDDRRRKAAFHTLVPSEQERQTYLMRGILPERIVATGYVKAAFQQRTPVSALFAEERPIVLFTPHWQAYRSSWPKWGSAVTEMLIEQTRFNVIFAPHQRLVERAPELRSIFAKVAHHPHVHVDLDSFSMVDGSYTTAADIYLGDTSSQLMEYLMRPRPAVFLDPTGRRWQDNPAFAMWRAGEVITRLDDVLPALERSLVRHDEYVGVQQHIAEAALGETSGKGATRAAEEIIRVLAM